ncbi:MAG: hypothetical protein K2I91_02095 [Muribaculaceae bacterium]|nr:hypothetical protein [Muribaculaceae bacterium]
MRNLLQFILRYSTGLVFTLLVLLSCMMLAHRDSYHTSVMLTSANMVSSNVYDVSNNVTGYFNLRDINERLQKSNAHLENENLNLRNEIAALRAIVSDTADIRIP